MPRYIDPDGNAVVITVAADAVVLTYFLPDGTETEYRKVVTADELAVAGTTADAWAEAHGQCLIEDGMRRVPTGIRENGSVVLSDGQGAEVNQPGTDYDPSKPDLATAMDGTTETLMPLDQAIPEALAKRQRQADLDELIQIVNEAAGIARNLSTRMIGVIKTAGSHNEWTVVGDRRTLAALSRRGLLITESLVDRRSLPRLSAMGCVVHDVLTTGVDAVLAKTERTALAEMMTAEVIATDEHRQGPRPDGTWGCACGWEQDKPHREHAADMATGTELGESRDV